jgi:murein DD-endopeptidase MepM/ murein hydrolase activator NlpD
VICYKTVTFTVAIKEIFYLSTKFISIEGYGEIQPLETKRKRKKSFSFSGIILSILYLLIVVPAKAVKSFSFKQWRKSFTVKKFMTGFVTPATAVALLVLTIGYWTNYVDFGLDVQYQGKTVASVTDSGVIQQAKEITNDKLSDDVDANFTPVYQVAMLNGTSDANEVSGAIVETNDSLSDNVAGLYINDELIGVCKSADELQSKLDALLQEDKEHYDSDSEIGFYNEVQVKEGIYSNSDIVSADDLIAKAEKSELLQVLVKTDVVITEDIPYDTKVKYDKTKASSYKKVTRKGVNGKQKTTYRISYLDGVQVDAVITDIKTTKKAVNKVVVKGKSSSSSSSSTVSSSGYMWPVPSVHTISSGYGYRDGGENHTGIDISDGNCYGATIVASRGGTVEWAGYDDSGYGNYVIINHGDGYKTLYGHCSALYVSKGQKVSQGQSIAAIGNTGQSYGNHLHFEVRTGDQRSDRQNPLSYVSY